MSIKSYRASTGMVYDIAFILNDVNDYVLDDTNALLYQEFLFNLRLSTINHIQQFSDFTVKRTIFEDLNDD